MVIDGQLESYMKSQIAIPHQAQKLIPNKLKTCQSIRRKYIHKSQGKIFDYIKFKNLV